MLPDTLSDNKNYTTFITVRKGKWADILCAGWPGLYVVSERFRDVMNGLTGVDFLPVNILDKNLRDIEVNYFRPLITGKSGPLRKELSREVLSKRIESGPEFIKKVGLYFDPESWDGCDFFSPDQTLFIFITAKAKELASNYNFTNVRIEPISEEEKF